ncbi:MAG: hypothetical protein H6Q69_3576 [Firmicutes bacterium]|nr:hypothetical protein [Bacillota bacterium]
MFIELGKTEPPAPRPEPNRHPLCATKRICGETIVSSQIL